MTFYIPDKSIKSNSTISDAVRVRGTNYIKKLQAQVYHLEK